jgi:hypothetical protein
MTFKGYEFALLEQVQLDDQATKAMQKEGIRR